MSSTPPAPLRALRRSQTQDEVVSVDEESLPRRILQLATALERFLHGHLVRILDIASRRDTRRDARDLH